MNGSSTKYRMRNGKTSWGYHFRPGKNSSGKWIRITKQGFSTKREADEALVEAVRKYRLNANVLPKPEPETFETFFHVWMKEYAERHCSPKTAERYRELGSYAIKHFGSVELRELRPVTLERAFNSLLDHGGKVSDKHPKGRPLAPKTVREVAFLVYGVLKKAKAWERVDQNPADFEKITLPKSERREAAIVEKANLAAFFAASAGTRLFPLLVLAAATGARRGELLALLWGDVDFNTGRMLVNKSFEETKQGLRVKSTKSKKPRSFLVPRQALVALQQHREKQNKDKDLFGADYQDYGLIFCRPDGGYYKPDKVSVRVTELARKCGLAGIGLHSLRHTHASELLSNGAPLAVVSDRLGHANPSITLSIYTHALASDDSAASRIWEDAMSKLIEQAENK